MLASPAEPAASAHAAYRLSHAAAVLRRDGVIAHPTEGVWGLACVASSADAVWRILASKRRDWRKGLILVADVASRFEGLLMGLPAERRVLVERSRGLQANCVAAGASNARLALRQRQPA